MKKWVVCGATLLLSLCLGACGFVGFRPDSEIETPGTGEAAGAYSVSVMVEETEGLRVTGENPVVVKAGEGISIPVELAPGYKIDHLGEGARYENGAVVLDEVWFPTTVVPVTRTLKEFYFFVSNNSMNGKLTASVEMGNVTEDTLVRISVEPKTGYYFLGFSKDAELAKGGELVSSGTEYEMPLTEDTKLYANYYYTGDGRLIVYYGNGADQTSLYDVFSNKSHYILPHTLANTGKFTREGYVLLGYNTAPDGSGTYYGTGWNILLPEKESPVLYAQWLAETPAERFTYKIVKNEVTITGYDGDDEIVVIPETIEGLPVTTLATNALLAEDFHTLYISRNIKTIETGAVKSCNKFEKLYFCDNVLNVSNDSFYKCASFKTLYMLACMAPRYTSGRNGNYQIKFQRLMTAQSPKLVIHSGSNVAYGVDSALLEQEIGHRYNVVNYGCNASTPASFYTEVIAHFIQPGDVVLMAPEANMYQYGYNEMNTTTWQIFEGAYDAYSLVDIRNYTKVFDSFASFNAARYKGTPRTYENYSSETVNSYGDYIKLKVGTASNTQNAINKYIANGGQGSRTLMYSFPYVENINRSLDMVKAAGGKVYYTFAAVMRISLKASDQTTAAMALYKKAVADNLHGTVISDPMTYAMDEKYFFNSEHHLNTEGSRIRTKNLAGDLLAQFAKEK